MKLARSTAIVFLAALTLTAAAQTEQATARDGHLVQPGNQQTAMLVDNMPPMMRAAYLKGIREELIVHGYDPGPDESAYDDRFTSAIQRYQIDAGLRPDGMASKALLEHLLFALPKVYADGSRGLAATRRPLAGKRIALTSPTRSLPNPDAEPVPSPAPRQRVITEPLSDRPTAARRSKPGVPRSLVSPGTSARPEGFVSRTQRALRDRGYYNGPIDGRFSDALSNAIRAFQKTNRLPQTGVIDAPLLGALS